MIEANQLMQIVDRIPVNQKSPATYPMKKFLLEKMRLIFKNRSVLQAAAARKRKQDVLDAYKKSVGFEKKVKAVREIKAKLEKAEKELMEVGLGEDGELLSISESQRYGVGTEVTVLWDSAWVRVSKETLEKVRKVQELLKAVEQAVETYTEVDRLETKLMIASTVGEVMAILNAAVGEPVFRVETKFMLEETTQKKGK